MKRILDFNPLTGESITFDYSAATDQMILTHEQDVEPILRQAAQM